MPVSFNVRPRPPSRRSRRKCSPAFRAQYQTLLSRWTRGLWRVWRCVLCSLFSTASFQLHLFVSALSAFGLVAFPLLRGLTTRSTGPIAACRHLGYKSLAQMPTRRNGPVSSNVRPHQRHAHNPPVNRRKFCGTHYNTSSAFYASTRKLLFTLCHCTSSSSSK